MRFVQSLLSLVLALFLIVIYLQATIHPLPDPPSGMVKLFDLPGENIVFQTLAERSRFPIFEPTGRVVVAIAELAIVLLLILPLTRRFGAILSGMLLAVAIGLHLSPWLGTEIPVALGSEETDGGTLFYLAIAAFVASAVLVFVHPERET